MFILYIFKDISHDMLFYSFSSAAILDFFATNVTYRAGSAFGFDVTTDHCYTNIFYILIKF